MDEPSRKKKTLDLTKCSVFSGQLLLNLAAAGMLREQAYKTGQNKAAQAWEQDGDFRAAIESDPEITQRLSKEQLAESFSVSRQLGNIDRIFERVFQGS